MVFIGDSFFPLDQDEKRIDVTREILDAFERYHDPNQTRPIRHHASSEEGYGEYRLTLHAASVQDFKNLFDFYVNLPGTERSHMQPQYVWRVGKSNVDLGKFFEFHYHPAQSLPHVVSMNELVRSGFVVFESSGRHDELTTWSHLQWLLATESSFVFIDYYGVTLH